MKSLMRTQTLVFIVASMASLPAFAHGAIYTDFVLFLLFGVFGIMPCVAALMAFVSWRLGATLRFAFIFGLMTLGLLSLFFGVTFLRGFLTISVCLMQCMVYVVVVFVLRAFPYFRRRNEWKSPNTKPGGSL